MDKNVMERFALSAIDTLETLKKDCPHNISYWVRVNGEVFGELPPDIKATLKPASKKKERKTDRPFTDWEKAYGFTQRLSALQPGQSLSISTPDKKAARKLASSMYYRAAGFWGAGNISTRCSKGTATLIRGA